MVWCSGPTRAEVLEDELAAATGAMHLASARVVEVLARVMAEGTWAQHGIRSPEHYVMWQCGVSHRRAVGLVALAQRRAELPAVVARFDAGELSEDHAASVAMRCPVSHDERVAEQAPRLTHPQLGRALRLLPPLAAEGEPPGPAGRPEPVRRFVFHTGDDGSLHGRFTLPPDEGALLEQALARHRQRLFDEAGNDAEHVTWVDALVAMAEAALHSDPGAERDRYVVDIHLDADAPDAPAHLHLGPVLPADLRHLCTCDAAVRMFLRENGRVVAKGRTTRVVNPTLRRIIEDRDGGCLYPLCTRRRWVDVHHLHHWEHGGPTDPHNLVCLCRAHHRELHRGEFTIEGDPEAGKLVFRARAGWVIEPPPPRPPGAPPDPPPGWFRPWGARITAHNLEWVAA